MYRSRSTATLMACALLASSALLAASPQARADENTQTYKTMLVLDSSGSMKEPAAGGASKIDVAKKALTSVITDMPVDHQMGLRVFGATVENASKPGACSDSQLTVPLGTNNKAALQAAVSQHKPYGETPIGYALAEAAKDLGSEGRRQIVLVSDGEATCTPDPCAVAKQIATSGVDLSIDVVGMNVDAKTKQQLQCIASSGKGKYYDANDADQLTQALEQTEKAPHRTGKPVKGTPTAIGAPSIQVGDWTDSIGASGTDAGMKHYQLHRTIPGSSIVVTFAMAPEVGHTDAIKAELVAGTWTCGTDTRSSSSDASSGLLTSTVSSVQLGNQECIESTDLLLRVTRPDKEADSLVRPTQIRVHEIPPVTNLQDMPEAPSYRSLDKPVLAAGRKVAAGDNLAAATPISSGITYENNAKPGVLQTYKLPVGWGQTMSMQVQIPKPTASLAKVYETNKMYLDIQVLDPAGMRIDRVSPTLMDWDSSNQLSVRQVTLKSGLTYTSSNPWLAGYYTVVVVARGPFEGPRNLAIPYRFVAKVDGRAMGVPLFAKSSQVPAATPDATDPATAEASQTPSESPTAEASETPSEEPSASQSPSEVPTELATPGLTSADAQHTPGGGFPWQLVLGGAGLCLLGGGAWLATRRRASRRVGTAEAAGQGWSPSYPNDGGSTQARASQQYPASPYADNTYPTSPTASDHRASGDWQDPGAHDEPTLHERNPWDRPDQH